MIALLVFNVMVAVSSLESFCSAGETCDGFEFDGMGQSPTSLLQLDLSVAELADPIREGIGVPATSTCNKAQLVRNRTLDNIRWLHIPKTGTSFIATLWNYACGQGDLPLDLNVDANARPGCGECYDFALIDRYPQNKYCTTGVLSTPFTTQHLPVSLQQMVDGQNVVSIFRRPNQRLISAHRASHTSGFDQKTHAELNTQCRGKGVACFANYPGIAGCMTRMLTGGFCADPSRISWDLQERADEAVKTVQHLRFVGLTEEWDESVCLFHLMFGGRMDEAELKDVHLSRGTHRDYDESDLHDFEDKADERVYAAAKARYMELRREHVREGASACEYLSSLASSENVVTENPADEDETHTCPSCAKAGRECGHMLGLDCGVCPQQRLGKRTEKFWKKDFWSRNLTCSPEGKCLLDGNLKSDVFSWHH